MSYTRKVGLRRPKPQTWMDRVHVPLDGYVEARWDGTTWVPAKPLHLYGVDIIADPDFEEHWGNNCAGVLLNRDSPIGAAYRQAWAIRDPVEWSGEPDVERYIRRDGPANKYWEIVDGSVWIWDWVARQWTLDFNTPIQWVRTNADRLQ